MKPCIFLRKSGSLTALFPASVEKIVRTMNRICYLFTVNIVYKRSPVTKSLSALRKIVSQIIWAYCLFWTNYSNSFNLPSNCKSIMIWKDSSSLRTPIFGSSRLTLQMPQILLSSTSESAEVRLQVRLWVCKLSHYFRTIHSQSRCRDRKNRKESLGTVIQGDTWSITSLLQG